MLGGGWLAIATRSAIAVAILAVCAGAALAQGDADVKRVLILYSDDQRLPATNIVGNTVIDRLRASTAPEIAVYTDFLDLIRFPEEGYRESLARFLREKHAGTRFDLVIALGPPALDFAVRYRGFIAPGARIVFALVAADEARATRADTGDAVGVFSEYSVSKTIELATRLQPEAEHIAVVSGGSEFDKQWEQSARSDLADFSQGHTISYLGNLAYDDLLDKVSKLPRNSIVLVLSVFEDGTGRRFIPREAAGEIARAASAPTYGVYDTFLGFGIVGAYSDTFESTGLALAGLAFDVLAGSSDATEDRINQDRAFRVDARELKRWGLSETNLPPETIILFDEDSFWERHWAVIVAALAVIAVQSALLAALLLQLARRRRAETERQTAEDDAAMQRREVAHMSRVLVLGELSGAIAHEINQPLTAILANAQAAQMMLEKDKPDIDEALLALAEIVEDNNRASEVIQRLRSLLKKDEGRWEPVDLNDIVTSSHGLLHSELVNRRIDTVLQLQPALAPVRGDPVQLQQVALNLMINAMDALAANEPGRRRMVVSTRPSDRGVELTIVDNGPGIPPAEAARLFQPFFTTKSQGLGLGLSICKSILATHGGTLTLSSGEDGGAVAAVRLPSVAMQAAAE
jgi:signal transduction histidine kinase